MTTENNNTVTLTQEQYENILQFSHFVKSLCYFVDESNFSISADSITPMLFSAASDFEKSFEINE